MEMPRMISRDCKRVRSRRVAFPSGPCRLAHSSSAARLSSRAPHLAVKRFQSRLSAATEYHAVCRVSSG
eukprot:8345279-Pyramimonas_sp.AAC.1